MRMVGTQIWRYHAEPYGLRGAHGQVWHRRIKRREERLWLREADDGVTEHELWDYLHDPDWPHWIEHFENDPETFSWRGYLQEQWRRAVEEEVLRHEYSDPAVP